MGRVALVLATGFGLGYCPFAPGTVGTLPGVGIAAALAGLTPLWQAAAAAVLLVLAVPVCDAAEKRLQTKDDHRIVADEYLSFPLSVIALPWIQHPWLLAVAFVTHRVFDIIKPPPAYGAQRLRGGLGIVADDAIASLYALAVNHAVWWLASRLG
jgi:phosphatidylglycerophosphatase A